MNISIVRWREFATRATQYWAQQLQTGTSEEK